MKVYVAGPYTGPTPYDVAANVTRAVDAGIALIQRGHTPFIPHLTHWVELRAVEIGQGFDYEDYMRMDQEWLAQCDALLYLGPSPGADRELAFAEQTGMTVFRTLAEIQQAVPNS